jgi:hypothetical protein
VTCRSRGWYVAVSPAIHWPAASNATTGGSTPRDGPGADCSVGMASATSAIHTTSPNRTVPPGNRP